ncbi:hypothetical protein Halru_0694 [Halovivax ruber XH-70]|uniref:DUF7344 domain-containing protein n=1 Tax=Halovivax ruber (strain DSM 18193 / JCM 13892 / XH-70) TaxID=797302 RepID=L0IAS9_HALRX|nr:hypothetical protein [Halovivax ruber]AGB15321.1 hypothetical protein Halru_0694 [Halovivax ruber XH-70]
MGASGEGDEPVVRDESGHSPAHVFALLASDGGRRLLTTLYDRGGTVPVGELADELTAGEQGDADAPTNRHAQKRLRHAILPTLADTGLVTYDRETDAVTLADRGDRLEPYLACVREAAATDVAWYTDTTTTGRTPTESDTRR